ncbi:hypothetical protein ACGFZH_28180 [Streptomyces zaomyceticus]|uniref:hypothetical protein n=1 Tax=Streptomyces zaomyceticus TaxID=68286 RepID=UPI0037122C88
MTRATAARAARREVAAVLAGRLDRIAIGHLDRLTPAEAGLLAETIRGMTADIEHLARDRLGLARARSADIQKRIAAEDAIREVEQDRDFWKELGQGARDAELRRTAERDAAKSAIHRVRAFVADIATPSWRAPGTEVATRIRVALDDDQGPLLDEHGEPICTCTFSHSCPACPTTAKEN